MEAQTRSLVLRLVLNIQYRYMVPLRGRQHSRFQTNKPISLHERLFVVLYMLHVLIQLDLLQVCLAIHHWLLNCALISVHISTSTYINLHFAASSYVSLYYYITITVMKVKASEDARRASSLDCVRKRRYLPARVSAASVPN